MKKATIHPKILFTYEIAMALLALTSVIFMMSENPFIQNLDYYIWMIFVVDVSVRFIVSENKWEYVKRNPFDIIAIIPLDNIFRLARLARLVRLLRAFAIISHYLKPFYQVIRTNHLDRVLATLFILIFVAAIPIQLLEPSIPTYTDAVWWAIVTATTVGYGDISPVTIVGRLIAIVLMLFGIGLLGMVTSSIASYFMQENREKEEEQDHTITYLKNEVSRIHSMNNKELERLKSIIDTYKDPTTR
ncbi:potassium channel family protein [Alkalihalobacillus sp. MEB130]|uniref:potassium channel family protein n=1 Tax=Alkalihalobacillus sp. MEB130 TaxID=2976704 RepID=UPI0028DDDDF3|nr:ion channel [Alkalihalobacillus sp. MEB130]MDT8862153.1 potassium channel family protein [Alkalihalobacillus sp. MEB130]